MAKKAKKKAENIKKSTVLEKKHYAFPTKSRCPRCRSHRTTATHTRNSRQYRQCKNAVCRHKWVVHGTII